MSVGLAEYQAASAPVSIFSPVGVAEESAVERLSKRLADAAANLFELLDEISDQISNCRSAKEFHAFREEVFPYYSHLMSGLGSIMNAKITPSDLSSMIESSFDRLEAKFSSEYSKTYFGAEAYYEIRFCVSTLRGASRWLPYIIAHKVSEERRTQDREIAGNYHSAATWTNFHLAGLVMALNDKQPMMPDVLQELLDGLRHSVMVYAYVRQALDLRNVLAERYTEPLAITWDAEDEALARAD